MWPYLRSVLTGMFHHGDHGGHHPLQPQQLAENFYRCGPRCGHVAFCDGVNLYVWGGYIMIMEAAYPMPPDELWVYHRHFDCWRLQKCGGDVPNGTSGASCVLLGQYAYVICGHRVQAHDNKVYRLHLTKFTWEAVDIRGSDISPRDKFVSWGHDDKIYCFGGYGPNPAVHKDWLFEHGAYLTDDGGGVNVWYPYGWNNQLIVLDPATCEWTNPKCMGVAPLPRAAHTAARLGDTVYVFGGRNQQTRMNDLHALHLPSLTWSGQLKTEGGEPEGRSWHTLSDAGNGRLFLYGGFGQLEQVHDDGWIMDTATLTWTRLFASTQNPRLWHTAVVTNSKDVLIFGGCVKNINGSMDPETGYSDKVLVCSLQPSSLKMLCLLRVAHLYKGRADLRNLPKSLESWVREKERVQKNLIELPIEFLQRSGPHSVVAKNMSVTSTRPP